MLQLPSPMMTEEVKELNKPGLVKKESLAVTTDLTEAISDSDEVASVGTETEETDMVETEVVVTVETDMVEIVVTEDSVVAVEIEETDTETVQVAIVVASEETVANDSAQTVATVVTDSAQIVVDS